MAGREGQDIDDELNYAMDPSKLDEELRRVFLGERAKFHHVPGTNKWFVSASTNILETQGELDEDELDLEKTAVVEFMLEANVIEASVRINEGIEEFLGPDDYEAVGILRDDPYGPVRKIELDVDHIPTELMIEAWRPGQGVPPYITMQLDDDSHIRTLFERLFHISEDEELPEEEDDA